MKDVERAREIRLWIGQVIVPAVTAGIFIYANPNARRWVSNKVDQVKMKFKKKES